MKDLSDWLDASDKSSAFSAIRPTDDVDRFPKKDHPTIAQADAKTDLRLIFKFLRLDTNKLAQGSKDRKRAEQVKTLSKSWLLLLRQSAKGPIRSIELWWRALVPTCAAHVLQCLQQLNLLSKVEKNLYKGDHTSHVGALSMNVTDAAKQKLHGIVHSLIADSPLNPVPNEDLKVQKYCLTNMGLSAPPDDPNKSAALQQMEDELSASLIRFRELVNHTIMWAMTELCHKETVDHFKSLHKKHLRENASANPEDIELFTAQVLYGYLENSCSVDNIKLIEGHRAVIKKIHRKARETPLVYLRRYFPFIHEINQLTDRPLSDEEEGALWKETWGENINMDETILLNVLSTTINSKLFDSKKWTKIKNYREGKFDTDLMEEFLQLVQIHFKVDNKSFPESKDFYPDDVVRQKNRLRYSSMQMDPNEINYEAKKSASLAPTKAKFSNPRITPKKVAKSYSTKAQTKNTRRYPKPQGANSLLTRRASAPLSTHMWCSNAFCVARGNHKNHALADCRSRGRKPDNGSSGGRSSNQASPHQNRTFRNNQSSKGKPSWGAPSKKCSICAGPHETSACQIVRNRRAEQKKRVNRLATPAMATRMAKAFYTPELRSIVGTLSDNYDLPFVCQRCWVIDCNGLCNPPAGHLQNIEYVKETLRRDPDLGLAFRAALNDADDDDQNCSDRALMAPLNVESFLAEHEWGQDDGDELIDSNPNNDRGEHALFDNDIFANADHNDQDMSGKDDNQLIASDQEGCRQSDSEASPPPEVEAADDLEEEDNVGSSLAESFFNSGLMSDSDPNRLALDEHFGKCVASPMYLALTDEKVYKTLICESLIKVRLADGTIVSASLKVDPCNTRMLVSEKYVHSIKSCYEYGLPPIRMQTVSKDPTAWKRDGALCDYYDRNGNLMTSLVYVEYHHPDLILMDMCTTLDAQVDSRHHMETSRSTGVEPLKRFVNKPYHYADFTPLGIDPWRDPNGPDASTFEPSMTEKAVASAKQILRSFRRRDTGTTKSNAKARRSGRLAAKRFTDQCMCSPRVVDSQAVDQCVSLFESMLSMTSSDCATALSDALSGQATT